MSHSPGEKDKDQNCKSRNRGRDWGQDRTVFGQWTVINLMDPGTNGHPLFRTKSQQSRPYSRLYRVAECPGYFDGRVRWTHPLGSGRRGRRKENETSPGVTRLKFRNEKKTECLLEPVERTWAD